MWGLASCSQGQTTGLAKARTWIVEKSYVQSQFALDAAKGGRKLNSVEEEEGLRCAFMIEKNNRLTSCRRCLSCGWNGPVCPSIVCCWVKGRSRQDVLVAPLVAQLAGIEVACHPREAQHPDLHHIRGSCYCSLLMRQFVYDLGANKRNFAQRVAPYQLGTEESRTCTAMPKSKAFWLMIPCWCQSWTRPPSRVRQPWQIFTELVHYPGTAEGP